MNLPGIKGSALFGTVARTKTRSTGCPFYAVSPGIKVIRIPSRHLGGLARLIRPGGAIPATFRFASVTNVMGNTDGKRNLKGGFLSRVHRMSTVYRIIHYFTSSGVARITKGISPVSSVRIVGLRLVLTSLRSIRGQVNHIDGLTGRGSGSSIFRLRVLRGLGRTFRTSGPTHAIRFARRRVGLMGNLRLLAVGPILCITGIDRSSMTSPSSGRCIRRIGRFTTGSGTRMVIVYTGVRSRVTRLSKRRGRVFLRRLNVRRSNLSRLVETTCGLLKLTACFATNMRRIHT